MIIAEFFSNKKLYVIGLGRTGSGALKSLLKSNAVVFAWDDNQANVDLLKKEFPDVSFESPNSIKWNDLDYVLLSPGIPTLEGKEHAAVKLARQNNIEIISDVDVLYLSCPHAKYIGITGTNGKSTTTALIGHILKELNFKVQVGGNIGISVLELESLDSEGVYVLELSSYQLELTKYLKLDIALFINITPDHIDRHGTFQNYLKAKQKIFQNQDANCYSIICIDYPECKLIHDDKINISNKVSVSTLSSADYGINSRILFVQGDSYSFQDYKYLPGSHNEENIVCAFAVCNKFGIERNKIVEAIKTFKGLKHRMEMVAEIGDVKFINDSKATNADAVEKALRTFDEIYWILGGIAKEGGINSLKSLFYKVKHAFIIGAAQDEFSKVLSESNIPFTISGNIEKALNDIKDLNLKKGVVLLSPACASFDQFKDFEQRGEIFSNLVEKTFINS
jgi:UDP-N-acetylmuramoylalanine--D-glutamate ligase